MKAHLKQLFSTLFKTQKQKKSFFYWDRIKTPGNILNILKEEGFVSHFFIRKNKIKIFLKQDFKNSFGFCSRNITQNFFLKTISISEIWKLSPNLGLLLLDTTLGVLSERKAKKKRVGGIISAYIRP